MEFCVYLARKEMERHSTTKNVQHWTVSGFNSLCLRVKLYFGQWYKHGVLGP